MLSSSSSSANIEIRPANPQEDPLIATHFYRMWRDNGMSETAIASDWPIIVQDFIHQARASLGYQAFVAVVNGQVVGSAGGQRFEGPYPLVLMPDYRLDGYIWGVYVEPEYRRQGLATRLTQAAIAHLQSLGCTHVVLNASPSGRPLYEQLGFRESNLMRLSLV